MKSTVRIMQIAFTYVGTVVGAGFATGQEILQFFTRYGKWGLLAILLATAAFMWLGTKMMILSRRIGAESYEDLNRHLFGPNAGSTISLFTLLILMGVNSIMLAGAGALFQEHLGLHYQTGLLITMAGSYLILQKGIRGIMQMNSLVVPLMLTLSLLIIGKTALSPGADRFLTLESDYSTLRAVLSPFLYTAFNLGMAQAVLVPLAKNTASDREVKLGGILGGAGIGFMLAAAHIAMSARMPGILQYEIPMASIAFNLGRIVQIIYLMLIFLEIFSTFVADIYGVTTQLKQRLRVSPSIMVLSLMLICYCFSQFGFSSLLSLFYPLFGAMALVWAVKLALAPGWPPSDTGRRSKPASAAAAGKPGPFSGTAGK